MTCQPIFWEKLENNIINLSSPEFAKRLVKVTAEFGIMWSSSNSKTLTIREYRIYPKYSDTSTPYHICSKIRTSTIHYPMLCLKIAG